MALPATPGDVPDLDRLVHAWQGKLTLGLSSASLTLAYLDWLVHLANAPGGAGHARRAGHAPGSTTGGPRGPVGGAGHRPLHRAAVAGPLR